MTKPLSFFAAVTKRGSKMASIEFSGIGITDAVGSVGGNSFQKNRSGSFISRKGSAGRNRSQSQMAVKTEFSYISSLWASLSATDIKTWNEAAASGQWDELGRVGGKKRPTGFSLFKKLNGTLHSLGSPTITQPPAKASFQELSVRFFSISVGAEEIEIGVSGDWSIYQVSVWASIGTGAGVRVPKVFLLFEKDWIEFASYSYQLYIAKLGVPVVGSWVHWEVFATMRNSGQQILIGKGSSQVS